MASLPQEPPLPPENHDSAAAVTRRTENDTDKVPLYTIPPSLSVRVCLCLHISCDFDV